MHKIVTFYEDNEYSKEDIRELFELEINSNSDEVLTSLIKMLLGFRAYNDSELSVDLQSANDIDGIFNSYTATFPFEATPKECIRTKHLVGSGVINLNVGKSDSILSFLFEILPKVYQSSSVDEENAQANRQSLLRMWRYATDLRLRTNEDSSLNATFNLPLHEWLINLFLSQITQLLSVGIRSKYVEMEGNLQTIRGKLLLNQNFRENIFKLNRFYCQFDQFSLNRPENRLIRKVLQKINSKTTVVESRRRSLILFDQMHEIPVSQDIKQDFLHWQDDHLMEHYNEIRSTCEWILLEEGSAPVIGANNISGRFVRMNDVFERYVSRWIQEKLRDSHYQIVNQNNHQDSSKGTKKLGEFNNESMLMRPDILIYDNRTNECVAVFDVKWKLNLDSSKMPSMCDRYQIFAYALHWLNSGDSNSKLFALIYPSTTNENNQSTKFSFNELGKHIYGKSFRFLIPTLANDNLTWLEGLCGDFDNPFEWLNELAVHKISE